MRIGDAPGSAAALLWRPLSKPWRPADVLFAATCAVVAALLAYGAIDTAGFLTVDNLKAILAAAAIVGIIAVGMTAIMVSGNLFSLSVGQTAAVTAMLFLYLLRFGLGLAIVLSVLLGLLIGAAQGAIIGAWGANAIIVTIGAGLLQEGVAVWFSHGNSIVPPSGSTSYLHLARPMLGIPFGVYVFFVLAILVEVLLRSTRPGRQLYLMGENRRAARAAALPIALLATGAFALAGACTGVAGVLIGATSANGSLLLIGTYTYDGIAATLVGGNAVTGGRGSVTRAVFGALLIATVSDLLLLRGYSTGVQILIKGIIVVAVIVLMNLRKPTAR